jgi:hypothetical protein
VAGEKSHATGYEDKVSSAYGRREESKFVGAIGNRLNDYWGGHVNLLFLQLVKPNDSCYDKFCLILRF